MFGEYYFLEALRRYAAAAGIDVSPTPPTTTPVPTTTTVAPTTTKPPTTTTPAPATDPVTAYHQRLGGASSYLGAPKGAVYSVAGGRAQDYAGGAIYWSSATGAHAVRGAILARYRSFGGPSSTIGFPTTDEYAISDGRRSDFARGVIVWSQRTNQTTVYRR